MAVLFLLTQWREFNQRLGNNKDIVRFCSRIIETPSCFHYRSVKNSISVIYLVTTNLIIAGLG